MPRRRDIRVWVQSVPGRFLALHWHDPITGKRRTVSTGTNDAAEAERQRADKEYELRHGVAEPSRMAWVAFIEMYLAERLASARSATREKAERVLTALDIRTLDDADERAIARYSARLRSEKRAVSTIHGNLTYLRAALRWAARQKLIRSTPAIDMPRLPKTHHIRTISESDFRKILAEAGGDWTLFLWTAWHTGMRRGELLALRWSDDGEGPWLDLDAERIWLPAAWSKSNADSWLPIHPDLKAVLLPARRERGPAFDLKRPDPGDVSKDFTRLCKGAKVKARLHDIRRTFGTRYAPLVPAQVLMRLMRHSSLATTMKYYADLSDALADAIRKG